MFRLNTLKDTAKILTVVTLDFSTLRGTSLQIFPLKGATMSPVIFIWESPTGQLCSFLIESGNLGKDPRKTELQGGLPLLIFNYFDSGDLTV